MHGIRLQDPAVDSSLEITGASCPFITNIYPTHTASAPAFWIIPKPRHTNSLPSCYLARRHQSVRALSVFFFFPIAVRHLNTRDTQMNTSHTTFTIFAQEIHTVKNLHFLMSCTTYTVFASYSLQHCALIRAALSFTASVYFVELCL